MTGRPAIAAGCAADGSRPWRAEVAWAEIALDIPAWGQHPASALRGAIATALGGVEAHPDWHGHGPDGQRQTRATVFYRVGPSRVWMWGPRALDNARELLTLDHLLLPSGDGVRVDGVSLRHGREDVGVHKEQWFRYELVTPYFPSEVAYARRPRREGPEQRAWAGQALASSFRMWLGDLGIEPEVHRPVHVQIEEYEHRTCSWRGRSEATRHGFVARFVSNAILPSGMGLGQHVSEGWGEVVRC